ncbi:hypothetical protein OAU13_00615 [bacterium]|nr:hypothetical protein [bacterium]
MGFTQSMRSMLADSHDGSVSSKRVVTLLAFLLCATAFIANLFWGFKIDEFIYNSMVFVVISGLGVTGLEKFAVNKIVKRMR